MQVKSHIAVSIDGFIASPDGWPTILSAPDFVSGRSHGYPEFIADCSAVVMGRNTFEPALGSPDWPWPDLDVFVLTSRPLPAGTPSHVVSAGSPADLLELMRAGQRSGDVHLVGGQQTIQAFRSIDALDEIGVVLMPILMGDGLRLTSPGSPRAPMAHVSSRAFPDGSVEHIYRPV